MQPWSVPGSGQQDPEAFEAPESVNQKAKIVRKTLTSTVF
jgi:hypothetical protein